LKQKNTSVLYEKNHQVYAIIAKTDVLQKGCSPRMTTTTWFCSVCGAVNEHTSTRCFACEQGKINDADVNDSRKDMLLHGRYQLRATVGTGGFSAVYRALDIQAAGRVVAVKQINLQDLSAEESIEATDTFNREVALLAELHHPQIPEMYDHFGDREHWYLVLEFIKGETLEHYLERRAKQGQPIQLEEAFGIITQLGTVLEYLHTCRPPVVFRDLKPGNIMRTPGGKLYLIDFGIARRYRLGQAQDTQRLGSPGYAAPEQYGRVQTTPQADLYSLGAILHQLLTGEDPSARPRGLAPQPLDNSKGGTDLTNLLQQMLSPNPIERPASTHEVTQTLEKIRQQQSRQQGEQIWRPPVPQIYTPEAGVQLQLQIQQKVSTPVPRRGILTRRRALIGLAAASLAVSGGVIWWEHLPHSSTYIGHMNTVTGVAWSPDGTQLASSSLDGTVHIWQMPNGNPILTYFGMAEGANAVTWSPNNSQLALAFQDNTIQIINANDGKETIFYSGHQEAVTSVVWSFDGLTVASGSYDKTVQVWNVADGQNILTYTGHHNAVTGVAWSPVASSLIASVSWDQTIQIWDTKDGYLVPPYQTTSVINGVAWSPDGLRIAAACQNQVVLVWDTSISNSNGFVLQGHTGSVNAVAWSPDGRSIASASDDGTVRIWNWRAANSFYTYTGHTGLVNTVAWSPDGKLIASGSADQTIQVWQPPQAS
jgi:eukaryotic-like serine/threonine-protein kinase